MPAPFDIISYIAEYIKKFGRLPPDFQGTAPALPRGSAAGSIVPRGIQPGEIPGFGYEPPVAPPASPALPGGPAPPRLGPGMPKIGPGSGGLPRLGQGSGGLPKIGPGAAAGGAAGAAGASGALGKAGSIAGWGMLAALLAKSLTEEGGPVADYFEERGAMPDEERLEPDPWRGIGGKPEWVSDLFGGGDDQLPPTAVDPKRLEAVERFKTADEESARREADLAALDKLIAAGRKSSDERKFVESLGYEPAPSPLSNIGAGIAVKDLPAEKLRNIRAQARAKGRAGSLRANVQPTEADFAAVGGGGTFSQAADTPELQARLKERDAWASDQPMRDMEFLASAEQARRNPELAIGAAESLTRMKQQKEQERRTSLQMSLVEKLGKGGKVPFAIANQLEAAGVNVPFQSRGTSPDVAAAKIQDAIRGAQKDISDIINDPVASSDPQAMQAVKFLEWVISMGPKYLEATQADPDRAMAQFEDLLSRYSQESGALAWAMAREAQVGPNQEAK